MKFVYISLKCTENKVSLKKSISNTINFKKELELFKIVYEEEKAYLKINSIWSQGNSNQSQILSIKVNTQKELRANQKVSRASKSISLLKKMKRASESKRAYEKLSA